MISNEELLKEISPKELLELSDMEETGTLNQSVIDDAMNDALSFIGSFIMIPDEPTMLLKDIATDLTILELKKRQNYPAKTLKEKREHCESLLLKMASKKIPTTITEATSKAPTQKKRSFRHNAKPLFQG